MKQTGKRGFLVLLFAAATGACGFFGEPQKVSTNGSFRSDLRKMPSTGSMTKTTWNTGISMLGSRTDTWWSGFSGPRK
jgi:hypothetical protein